MENERRKSSHVQVDCEIAIQIGTDYFPCSACNVAEGGVLALLPNDTTTSLQESDEGICWLDYRSEGFEATFQITRLSGNYIALIFLVLKESQKPFLRKLSAASPR